MRKTLFALAAVAILGGVAFVGCGGDDSNVQIIDAGKDGPIVTGGDAAPPKVGCAGYVTCINDCFAANPMTATGSGCRTMCDKTAKPTAAMKYGAAIACGQDFCAGNLDAGGNKCTLSADGKQYVDRPGDPTDTCTNCLGNSLANLFGDTCKPASPVPPECNPAECKTITDACLNDK